MTYLDICRLQLPIDEGVLTKPYTDTKGKITIGIGFNLTDDGLDDGEISFIFSNRLQIAVERARTLIVSFDALTEARKAVLVNMAYNLGWGLRAFQKMIAAVEIGDWPTAAAEMKNSDWAREVGPRADRLEAAMLQG
jgi:lysozyme